MFTQLRLKNFKAWKGEHHVDLAPLSLFLGTNSAGKTSLLQMLLLLKQTAESPDRRQSLNLGGQPGDLLHLGGLKDIISGHDLKRELAFGLTFTGSRPNKQRPTEFDVSYCHAHGGIPVVKSLMYSAGDRVFRAERQQKGAYQLTAADPAEHQRSKRYEPERSVASDRKFVATALSDLANGDRSTIINAVDSDWCGWEASLKREGIVVEHLIDGFCDEKRKDPTKSRVKKRSKGKR